MSGSNGNNVLSKSTRNVAPGRHIIQAESIVIHKTLGSGEFGTVQQGVWTSDDNERVSLNAFKIYTHDLLFYLFNRLVGVHTHDDKGLIIEIYT